MSAQTLQSKFVRRVLPVVGLVAIVFSVLLGVQDYRNSHAALQTKQRNLPEAYSVALAALSQNFKPASISRVIASLKLDPDVANVVVFDDQDNELSKLEVVHLVGAEKGTVVEKLIVDDTVTGRMTTKGKIRITFHARAVGDATADRAVKSVMNILLLVGSIFLTALVVNRRIIGLPLERFLIAIRGATDHNSREPVAWSSQDEIGQVILAFNQLVAKLATEEAALRERSEELTRSVAELRALGEVGRAVSSTLDLQTVLVTIITHAVELAKADAGGTMYEFDEATGVFEPRANFGVSDTMVAMLREARIRLGETTVGICAERRAPFQIPDFALERDNRLRDLLMHDGIRSVLAVPLLRDERVIGALVVRRKSAGEFPESTVKLLQNFAAQSVLAIENARLFHEVHEKGRELEVASQHKSQFLANMSHELRTPLNAIIGVTEMLHEDARDLKRDDEIEPLERVLRAARHLLALINDILDLSKIEAGKTDLYVETFAIAPLLEDVVNTTNTLAAKNGNRVVVNCPIDIGAMKSDQTRIRQALLNLASNAAKFTERGTITIDAKRTTEEGRAWITIAVTDSGIGMTPEQVGRLFQDFTQADASTTRKYGGTGLGLAISQRFCRMMGGDITVESAPGSGSTFLLRLPAEVAGPGETAEVRAAVASPRVEGCNLILVVDDDETMRDLMDRFLSKEGFTVAKASGGREALQLAHELRPDAITLDVMMPDLDGWTVLAAIKGDPELADTPVILMTILDEKTRGFALGAAEFMVKPVDRERLATTLKKLCSSAGRRVLVVDDDKFVRDDVQRSLEREGWQVTQAENGQIALARLAESRPDIIVLDLMMPEMDGFEFLAALRDRPEWHEIPVLVVTARDLTAEDRARLTGGVKRIIPKGTSSRDEVLREVARLLRASVKRDELPEMESTT